MPVSANEVVMAYRMLLGREPENEVVVQQHAKGPNLETLRQAFLHSKEFRTNYHVGVAEVDCGEFIVIVDPTEPDFGQRIVESKTWEPHVIDILKEELEAGQTFLDIGANVGLMSFWARHMIGDDGLVIAFEPNVDNLQLLYRGIVRNGYKNVRVSPVAASDTYGIVQITQGSSNSYIGDDGTAYVQTVPCDDVLQNIRALNFVKIDIEGHELQALRGMRRLIEKFRPAALVEWNPRCLRQFAKQDPREVLDLVFELFRSVIVVEHDGEQTPFSAPAQLYSFWERRNSEVAEAGVLPDGMLHFELLLR